MRYMAWKARNGSSDQRRLLTSILTRILTALSCLLTAIIGGCNSHETVKTVQPIGDNSWDSVLIPVVIKGRIGFIGTNGSVKIPPRYSSVGTFSNGLAPARIKGTFGYINTAGDWIIEPSFDYASDFHEGCATVWKNGEASIISLEGKLVHIGQYDDVGPSVNGVLSVSRGNETGLITRHGAVLAQLGRQFHVLDSQYVLVRDAAALNSRGVSESSKDWSVIDHHGKVVSRITGYAKVVATFGAPTFLMCNGGEQYGKYRYALYAANGQLLRHISEMAVDEINDILPCGHMCGSKKIEQRVANEAQWQRRVLDHDGNVVLVGHKSMSGYKFGTNALSSFEADTRTVTYAKCTHSKLITSEYEATRFDSREIEFSSTVYDNSTYRFQRCDNYGIVRQADEWRVLDVFGRLSASLNISRLHSAVQISPTRLYTTKLDRTRWITSLEIFEWNGKAEPLAVVDSIEDVYGVWNGGIFVLAGKRQTLLDSNGRIVWQGAKYAVDHYQPYGLDFRPIVWREGSRKDALLMQTVGLPHRVRRMLQKTTQHAGPVSVVAIDGESKDVLDVYIINTGSKEMRLNSSDSRLYLTMQAKRRKSDEWQPIEHLTSSWCGNSYYNVRLPAQSYWKFVVPRYRGDLPVLCRMHLEIDRGVQGIELNPGSPARVVSNTFNLSVNPGQLWRILPYRSTGLMDPY